MPENLEISWNKRLLKTAGLCKYLNHTIVLSDGTSNRIRSANILLSEKVCTSAERVRDTLFHEVCHAAVWILNGTNDGHGRLWRYWAAQIHRTWPELPMITVCHAYNIETRFTYRCTGCGVCINRHSKSIDLDKKVCGTCRARLELFINTPKGKMLTPNEAASLDKRLKAHCTPKLRMDKKLLAMTPKHINSETISPVLNLEKELNQLNIYDSEKTLV